MSLRSGCSYLTDDHVVLTPEEQRGLEEICFQSGPEYQFDADVPQDWTDVTMGDVADSSETHEACEFEALAREIMGGFQA